MPLESSHQREAPQLQPVIAEILRTCVYPSFINLRVEQVNRQRVAYDSPSTKNHYGYIIGTYLTDGELVIQALLHRKLCTLAEIEDLTVGDIIEIHKFVVKKAKRTNGYGDILYLGIENCYVIKDEAENNKHTAIGSACASTNWTNSSTVNDEIADIDGMAGGFFPDYGESFTEQDHINALIEQADRLTDLETIEKRSPLGERFTIHEDQSEVRKQKGGRSSPSYPTPRKRKLVVVDDVRSDDEAFETVRVDLHTAKKRREALHELSQNMMSSPLRPPTRGSTVMSVAKDAECEGPERKQTVRFNISKGEIDTQPVTMVDEKRLDENRAESRHTSHTQYRESHLPDSKKSFGHSLPLPASTNSRPTTPIHSDSQLDSYGPQHNLVSLYSPSLPSKSYTFTTLIIPTHVSTHLITRPNSPFPPKRHIKVIDSSIVGKFTGNSKNLLGKGVTVSVYRDAMTFKPTIGKVALMRGVVMQRISGAMKSGKTGQGEVILNVYPIKSRIQKQSQNAGQRSQHVKSDLLKLSDQDEIVERRRAGSHVQSGHELNGSKPQIGLVGSQLNADETAERHWFVDDHDFLRQHGYDVDIMQQWWDEMMVTK